MNVGSTTAASQMAAILTKAPEASEGSGPDRDGDGDNGASVKSATTAGVGKTVDISA